MGNSNSNIRDNPRSRGVGRTVKLSRTSRSGNTPSKSSKLIPDNWRAIPTPEEYAAAEAARAAKYKEVGHKILKGLGKEAFSMVSRVPPNHSPTLFGGAKKRAVKKKK